MDELIDVQGVWWLPDDPTRKVSGWFRYDPDDGGTLRLSAALRPLNWIENPLDNGRVQRFIARRPKEDQLYPRIHGQSGHRLFHLEDCFQLSLDHGLCREDDSAESVHVNWLIEGAHFDGEGQVEVDSAVAEIQYLTSWIGNDALELNGRDNPEGVFATAAARLRPTETIELGGGLSFSLAQRLSTAGDHHEELTLAQQVLLRVSATQHTRIDILTDRVSAFQDLLTIATGQVANIQRLHFTHAAVPQLSLAGTAFPNSRAELGLHTRWANRDANRDGLSPYAMRFTFDDLGGMEGVGRWMQVADRYTSELRRIMAVRYNPNMLLEDRVSHCVAALESFDRVRRGSRDGDTHLVERLRKCVDFAGHPFRDLLGGETIETWTERAKNHRHALGHHLDRFRNNMKLIERDLGDQLLWLATLCLLREASVPPQVFDRLEQDSHFRWVADRAAMRAGSS